MNDAANFTVPLITEAQRRQGTVAHELGHGLALDHPDPSNQFCISRSSDLARPIMDSDCMDYAGKFTPQGPDVCPVNHVYYDPSWGYSGC